MNRRGVSPPEQAIRSIARGLAQAIKRHPRVSFAGVLVVACTVRGVALASFTDSSYGEYLFPDENTYHNWAQALLLGERVATHDLSALPAYLLACVYKLGSVAPNHMRVLNVVLGTLACAFIYRCGAALGGECAGALAGIVAALYKPFVFLSVTLLKESLVVCAFSVVIWSLLTCRLGQPLLRLALLGAASSVLFDVRPNAVLAVAVAVVMALSSIARGTWGSTRGAPALAVVLGFVSISTPLMLLNHHASGRLSPMPVGGFNLYLGNYLPSSVPFYRPVPFVSSTPSEQTPQFAIEASRRTGHPLTAAEASGFWTWEVLAEARRQPRAFARKLMHKALAVLNAHEEADNHDIEFLSRFVPFLQLPLIDFGLLMPLGVAGLLTSLRRDPRLGALLFVASAYTVTLILFFSNMRIRLPLVVLLIPCAAVGVRHLVLAGRTSVAGTARFALLVVALGAIANLPLPGKGDLTAHYNFHAIKLSNAGDHAGAEGYWTRSAAAHGAYSDYGRLWLALGANSRGDSRAAHRLLANVSDASFAAAHKHDLSGDLLRTEGRLDEAALHYERAIAINAGLRTTRQKLIDVYNLIAPDKARLQTRDLSQISRFYQ